MVAISDLEFYYNREEPFRLHVPKLTVDAGTTLAVIGPSGTGKTTLLNVIAGIVTPVTGSVVAADALVHELGDNERRSFRVRNIGLVFQEFELLSYLSVLDNILLPYRIHSALHLTSDVRSRARDLARHMQIDGHIDRHVDQLSQGERQRVAICRALLPSPPIVLADEPTGNLDPSNKGRVLDLLFDYVDKNGTTLVTVTHDHGMLDRFDNVIEFDDLQGPPRQMSGTSDTRERRQ